ncbi:MAG: O-antigen ligase family protein [Saprospiraceae bacterium]|nr:O-antigen ligase family protein [Saprospiraceae bacterium]
MREHQFPISYKWIIIGSYAFLALSALAYLREQWIVIALPAIILILLLGFFKPSYLFFAIAGLTPLSINLEELGRGEIAFYLPTEPLLFAFMVLIILGQLYRDIIPREIILHPLSKVMYLYIIWLFITSLTSTDPIVSIKFLVSRLWFIVPVYFAGATIFLKPKNIPRFFLVYLVPFIGVVLYTTLRHASYGFEEDPAHWAMEPFYRDHTQYGTVVAFFIPIVFGFVTRNHQKWQVRAPGTIVLALLIFTCIYTYSRAALLSVIFAFAIWFFVKMRASIKILVALGIALSLVLFLTIDEILVQLQKNHTDSSENLVENVESITNITTDASNLERLNRWNSVFAMAKERPIFGFGPGTYMFEYAPYQKSGDLTIISTNFGDVGNAHSEYLGPLAETGYIGLLIVLLMLFILFRTAYRVYRRLPEGQLRHFLLFSTLALTTYFAHGFLNNFLDSDKASVPVFGTMAIVVAIDVLSRKQFKV